MNIVPFSFEGAAVRVIDRDGEPWFVLADVCDVLKVGNLSDAARRLDDDEKGVDSIDTPGGPQEMTVINESGLYSLILTSRKAAARRFKKWVTAEVLPAIRRSGRYGAPTLPDLSDPVVLVRLQTEHASKRVEAEQRAAKAEQAVEVVKPKATFFDQFANTDGLYNLQNAARVLGQGPNTFIRLLKQGYLFYQGGALVPKAQYCERGLFEVKATIVDDKARYQTYVTPKGIQYFAGKLDLDRLPLEVA
jgi:prophage antirepressor-like protein